MKKKTEKVGDKTYSFETLTSPSTMKKIKGGSCRPVNEGGGEACRPEQG